MSDNPLPTREEIAESQNDVPIEPQDIVEALAYSLLTLPSRNLQLLAALDQLAEKDATIAKLKAALIKQEHEISGTLGNALYGTSEEGLPLWGDHVAETLAIEASREVERLKAREARWMEELSKHDLGGWIMARQVLDAMGVAEGSTEGE